jgi:DNA-binding response OmpR family regulator
MRVLIVEDSDDLRYLYARALRRRGLVVCEAADGQAGLDALERFRPDLVITDLMMPVVDGVGFITGLRLLPGMDVVIVVAITAASSWEADDRARKAGADEVIEKPIDVGEISNRWLPFSERRLRSESARPHRA